MSTSSKFEQKAWLWADHRQSGTFEALLLTRVLRTLALPKTKCRR